MNYNDMTRMVSGRTALTKRRSDEVIVGTLTVLSEVTSPQETKDLLAQLPKSLRERVPVSAERIEMRPIEFVARVADLVQPASVDEADGYVRAVFATLTEAVNTGEMRDIFEELGGEFADLFGRFTPPPQPAPAEPAPRNEPVAKRSGAPTPQSSSASPTLVDGLGVALVALIKLPGAVLGCVVRLLPTSPGK